MNAQITARPSAAAGGSVPATIDVVRQVVQHGESTDPAVPAPAACARASDGPRTGIRRDSNETWGKSGSSAVRSRGFSAWPTSGPRTGGAISAWRRLAGWPESRSLNLIWNDDGKCNGEDDATSRFRKPAPPGAARPRS